MIDVCCVGESPVVLAPDPPAPLVDAPVLRRHIAGAESNVACYLALLGTPVAWVSRLGDDPFGRYLRAGIGAAGVDCALVEVDPAAPTAVYFKDPGPDGTTVHYYRRGSAASTMDTSVWDRVAAAGPRLVHVSGITAALSATCLAMLRRGVLDRPVPRATVSFDVNYRPALWRPEQAGPVLGALADHADIVFVGLDEAGVLWDCATPREVRDRLPGAGTVVVKDGAVGATAFTGATEAFVPAPPVEVVEAVGAGDAFAAGYLYGTLRGWPQDARLAAGHRIAGIALTTTADVGDLPPDILAGLPDSTPRSAP